MMQRLRTYLFKMTCVLVSLSSLSLSANDLVVANTSLGDIDLLANTQQITFDAAWDNSWRTSTLESNYDAAWIFAKYRIQGSNSWKHVKLFESASVQPEGAFVEVVSDSLGVFIYRDSDGIGPVSFTQLSVMWDRNANGLSASDLVEICLIGIEMVYVPQANFQLGDGSTNLVGSLAAQDSLPRLINSEDSLVLGGSSADALITLNANSQGVQDDFGAGNAVGLPALYPKGYKAFYTMKYEIDMGLYTEMLNKLNSLQASTRYNSATGFGNTIVATGTGEGYSTSTPARACNYLRWADIAALADWAGLRPMSEFEYEKSCRGELPALENELATGSVLFANAPYTLVNEGTGAELITDPQVATSNILFSLTVNSARPMRTGIVSASALTKNRLETGGSRYGVMELTGNMWEFVVSIGSPEGRAYTGAHGDGEISSSGEANQGSWPSANGQGAGIRGGGIFSTADKLPVSTRNFANFTSPAGDPDVGGRLVRSAD